MVSFRGLVWGQYYLVSLIGDVEGGVECTFRKFGGDTRLNDEVDTQSSIETRHTIQRDCDRAERWTHANFMIRPNAGSCVWVVAILNVHTGWAMRGLRGLGCAGG